MWPFTSSSAVPWTAQDIPPQDGKVFLITGGTSGLGKQSILDLARAAHPPAEIWLTGRTMAKCEEAIKEIKSTAPNAIIKPLELNLSSFASIKTAAATFTAASPRLDVLMLNAGCMGTPYELTADGYESQFGANHMGHALLVKLLTPVLDKTAAITAAAAADKAADVRVVVLSSRAVVVAPKGGIVFDSLKTPGEAIGAGRYAQSKLANALYARLLARAHPLWTVTAIHPGVVHTNLFNAFPFANWLVGFLINMSLVVTCEVGARNQLWAATAPKKDVVSGALYYPVGDLEGGSRGPYVGDDVLAKKLWDWTEEELKGQAL